MKTLCLTAFYLFTFGGGAFGAPSGGQSVYRLSRGWDIGVITGGALATAVPYLLQESIIRKRCPCDPNEVNPFDRPAIGNDSQAARILSDVLVGAMVAVPVAVDYWDLGLGDVFWEDATVFAQALLVNGGVVALVKHAVQRPIPLSYSGQTINDAEGYRAFYAGHVSTFFAAFTAASYTWYLRYHPGAAPWIAGTALGAVVAWARVAGGNHFASDVIVGAVVGSGIGLAVPWLHRHSSPDTKIAITPLPSGGAQLMWMKAL